MKIGSPPVRETGGNDPCSVKHYYAEINCNEYNKDESANCLFLTQIVFPDLSRTRITGEMILSWVKSNVIKGRGEILKGQGFSKCWN